MLGFVESHQASTWGTNHGAGISYTGLTITGGGSSGFVSGTTAQRLAHNQKIYYEFTVTATAGHAAMGFQNINASLSNYTGSDTNGCSWYFGGDWSYNGAQTGVALTPANGNICSVAIDGVNDKIWARINGGNWNADVIANQNPATNTGGFSPSAAFGLPIYISYSSNNATTETIVLNAGSSAFAYAIPVGFRPPNSCSTS